MSITPEAQTLIKQGDYLFGKKQPFDSYCQEVANNFCPQRADFTSPIGIGAELANNLTTSYPLLASRSLTEAISSYLRPAGQQWLKMTVDDEEKLDNEGRRWLEWATKRQIKFMYDKMSGFQRAVTQGDQDYSNFGQCVISVEADYRNINLLHRCWHIRDMAWCEDSYGILDTFHRKWTPTAIELSRTFPGKIHQKVKEKLDKKPYDPVNVRHIIIPVDQWNSGKMEKKYKTPFVSLYVDVDNNDIIEEVGSWTTKYVIPRWQLVSGSQYAYSPAVIAALPDARLIQAITLTLLEAGEKAVNPPMIATQDVIRGDVAAYSGGITWVDYAYDERQGEALRAMSVDKSGLNYGLALRDDIKATIIEAFYLNKLNLPITGQEMTATEVTQRIQEYIRNALPLFQPMETEYNATLCEMQFDVLFRAGAFGPLEDIPQSLSGKDINFNFENPLVQAQGKEKGQKFLEAKAALAEAVALDPSTIHVLDAKIALRDTLNGIGIPAKWLRDEKVVDAIEMQEKQQAQAQQMIAALGQGAQVAEQVGKAGIAVQEAGMM